MITKRFSIEGLHCANCALRAEKVLNKQPGVAAAVCNFAAAEVQVKYDPKATNAEQLAAAIDQAGYRLIITQQNDADGLHCRPAILSQRFAASSSGRGRYGYARSLEYGHQL